MKAIVLAVVVIAPSAALAQGAGRFFEPPAGPITEACRSWTEIQRQDRDRWAASNQPAMAAAMDEQYRLSWQNCSRIKSAEAKRHREEQAVAEEIKAKAAEQARQDALAAERATKPDWVVPAMSAVICTARNNAAAAKRAIVEERALARRTGGGIVDMRKIYDLQQDVREMEANEREARDTLKQTKRAPIACPARVVQRILRCGEGEALAAGEFPCEDYLAVIQVFSHDVDASQN